MKELGKRGTALMVIGLVIAVGVLIMGAGFTMFVPLDPRNWRFWVVVRITVQVGIAFGLGLLIAKVAELPRVWMGGASIVVGLVLAWSATPDLIEGPVAIDGRVTVLDVTHGLGRMSRWVWGTACFRTDDGVELCLEPVGLKITRMRDKLARCNGHLHALVLRHLDVLLEVKCTGGKPGYGASDEDRAHVAFGKNRRITRRARVALSEVRLQSDKDRRAWAAQVATADPELLEGTLEAVGSADTWALPAFEGAIVRRTDVVGQIAANVVVVDFPEQARAMAKRLHGHGGHNVPELESQLGPRR